MDVKEKKIHTTDEVKKQLGIQWHTLKLYIPRNLFSCLRSGHSWSQENYFENWKHKKRPHRFYVRLVGRSEYKLRVGDYRVIADIEENSRVIIIRSLGPRKNIYRWPALLISHFYNRESQLQSEWTGWDSANALGEYMKPNGKIVPSKLWQLSVDWHTLTCLIFCVSVDYVFLCFYTSQ